MFIQCFISTLPLALRNCDTVKCDSKASISWLTCRTEIKSHLSGNKSLLFSENNPSVNFLYVFIAFVCMAVF